MNSKEAVRQAQFNILELLAVQEETIGLMYAAFARAFPDLAAFWSHLDTEEQRHAAIFRSLQKNLDKGHLFFNIGRFNAESIQELTRSVNKSIEQVNAGTTTAPMAFMQAIVAENSLLEKHFFDTVESDSPEFKHLAAAMTRATSEHRDRLEANMRKFTTDLHGPKRADT